MINDIDGLGTKGTALSLSLLLGQHRRHGQQMHLQQDIVFEGGAMITNELESAESLLK